MLRRLLSRWKRYKYRLVPWIALNVGKNPRSCSGRDRLGPYKTSDVTWLTEAPSNPLGVGQYVNNCSNEKEANVYYQEFDVPSTFPLELRQYIPNVNYRHDVERPLRCVVLVALRDIEMGEELFSNYYTIIK